MVTSSEISVQPSHKKWLFRFAVFFAVFVLAHIKFGAMVTSTGSGMAYADWPQSGGSWWPEGMDFSEGFGRFFEGGHRLFGTLVGMFNIVLVVWVHRSDSRRWLKKLTWLLLFLITVQGIVGGIGVLLGDTETGDPAWWTSVIHGTLAQPSLCLAVFIAFTLSRSWRVQIEVPAASVRVARKMAVAAIALVFLQLAIGSTVRHTDLTGMLWLHILMAMGVSVMIFIASSYVSARFGDQSRGMRNLSRWIWGILSLQLMLGFVTLAVRRIKDPSNIEYLGRSLVVSGHVVCGATLFLLATLLLAQTYRTLVPSSDD